MSWFLQDYGAFLPFFLSPLFFQALFPLSFRLLSQGHTRAFKDSKPAGDALRWSLSRSLGMSIPLCRARAKPC